MNYFKGAFCVIIFVPMYLIGAVFQISKDSFNLGRKDWRL
jgi:hypothetical protein